MNPEPCGFCEKAFSSQATLYVHRMLEHKSIFEEAKLMGEAVKILQRRAMELEPKKITILVRGKRCEGCNETFTDKQKFLDHTPCMISGTHTWPCGECTKVYRTSEGLRHHMMMTHHGETF